MFIKHRLLPWLLAATAGFVVASVSHSQAVLYRLTALGIEIPLAVRLQSTWNDLVGLSPAYWPIIGVGLAIALPCAGWLSGRWPSLRLGLFMLAGFTAMAAILLSMQPIMEITVVAGARGALGMLAQCLSGAIAGAVFALTAPPKFSGQ